MHEALAGKIFLFICGGVLLSLGLYLTGKTIGFLRRTVRTTGKVKSIDEVDDGKKKLYTPVMTFVSSSGETFEFSPKTRSTGTSYRIGGEVTVLYDPDFPEDAKTRSFASLWLGPVALLIAAALILVPALVMPVTPVEDVPAVNTPPPAPEDFDPYKYYLLFWIGPGLFGLFGVVSLGMGLLMIIKMIASLYWPTARGKVLQSSVRTSGKFYSPHVKYEFHVNGRKYVSTNFDVAQGESGSPLESRRVVHRYPAGKTVAVHYNPRKPKECVLEPGISWPMLLIPLAAGAGFSFVAWIFWAGSREGWLN